LLAAILWSLNGALIKLINQRGTGPDAVTIAFYRSLIAGLFLLPFARGRYHTLRSEPGSRWKLPIRPAGLLCIVFFAVMTVLFVLANTMTKAASAIILQYTSTFWVFGLSPWLLKEKPTLRDLPVLLLAMIGIGVIFVGGARTDLAGLAVALASGVFYALLTMMIRLLRDSDSAAITVMNNLGSAVLILPAMLLMGQFMVSGRVALLLVIMGVVQFGIPYYLYSLGLVRVPAYQVALITMVEPVLVPVWTYLAVGETPPSATIIGGAIILAALLLLIVGRRSRLSAPFRRWGGHVQSEPRP